MLLEGKFSALAFHAFLSQYVSCPDKHYSCSLHHTWHFAWFLAYSVCFLAHDFLGYGPFEGSNFAFLQILDHMFYIPLQNLYSFCHRIHTPLPHFNIGRSSEDPCKLIFRADVTLNFGQVGWNRIQTKI